MTPESPRNGLTILFVMLNPGFAGHYDTALRRLIGRGHRVVLAYQSDRNKDGVEQVYGERLRRDHPDAVTIVTAPDREAGRWTDLTALLRHAQDYLRYYRPEFRDAFALRARARQATPATARVIVRMIALFGPAAVRGGERLLAKLDARVPPSTAITGFVQDSGAGMLLVTPLVDTMSSQVDYVRAAQGLGIPAGHCVASWDNLTNKGSMRVVPDGVFVWNEAQKQEAVALHRVPPANVVITGAQLFDKWFETKPVRSREEFCRRVGLPADRPFILYLGSSAFIAPQEAVFVERWIRAIRNAPDAALARAGVLIRPHPNNASQFMANDFTVFGDVVLWPPFQADRLDPLYEADYFESMYYCAAAVGVNTSGMLESAIVGRPVHTVLEPDFRHSQRGTLHFNHIAAGDTALLHTAASLGDHIASLAAALRADGAADPRSAAFVASFVRPLGLDRPAAPVLADAIEAMGALQRQHGTSTAQRPAPRWLTPLALLASATRVDDDRQWWGGLVAIGVACWVFFLRVRFAVVDSAPWAVARRQGRNLRSASRNGLHETAVIVRQSSRRVRRTAEVAWERTARRARIFRPKLTLAQKRVRRFVRGAPKDMRRRARSAVRAVRRRLPGDPWPAGRHRGE